MSIQLYGFQEEAVEGLRRNIRGGVRNQVLSSPTGSGKTIVATYLLDECYNKGKRAVFVADRIPLIDQTSAVLDKYDIPHGVIQADHWRWRPWERIQVASAQTLARRKWPDGLNLIIVDESHTCYKTITNRIGLRDCVVIGLTATPFAKGMGRHYDAVVSVTTTNRLIADGFLSNYRIFAASEPDMRGAKVVAGEWTDDEAARRAMPIIGDCVAEYLKHGGNKKFIAFGVNVAHCEELRRQFNEAGVICGLYTYQTGDEERARMVQEFRKPDSYIRGLISVSALAKGFDVSDVEVIIMCRPLRSSLTEHVQILGRGLRAHPGKEVCTVLDHAGNTLRFWDQMHEFFENGASTLDDGKRKEKKPRESSVPSPLKCPRCAAVHARRPMCPACGYEYPRRSGVEHVAGELTELAGRSATRDQKQQLYSMLLYVARMKNYRNGWAKHCYRERCGVWPQGLHETPLPPSPQLLGWLRHRAIAHSKARR